MGSPGWLGFRGEVIGVYRHEIAREVYGGDGDFDGLEIIEVRPRVIDDRVIAGRSRDTGRNI